MKVLSTPHTAESPTDIPVKRNLPEYDPAETITWIVATKVITKKIASRLEPIFEISSEISLSSKSLQWQDIPE